MHLCFLIILHLDTDEEKLLVYFLDLFFFELGMVLPAAKVGIVPVV